MRRGFCLMLVGVLSGCGAGWKPLPDQRAPVTAEDPPDHRFFVRMIVPSGNKKIVRDIGGTPSQFRWTGERPAVQVRLPDAGAWVAQMEFAIADATFKETGPVTVELFLNGKALGQGRFAKPGEQILAIQVPPDAIPGGGDALLEARISPVWVAPSDGAKLGVLLKALGFLRP